MSARPHHPRLTDRQIGMLLRISDRIVAGAADVEDLAMEFGLSLIEAATADTDPITDLPIAILTVIGRAIYSFGPDDSQGALLGKFVFLVQNRLAGVFSEASINRLIDGMLRPPFMARPEWLVAIDGRGRADTRMAGEVVATRNFLQQSEAAGQFMANMPHGLPTNGGTVSIDDLANIRKSIDAIFQRCLPAPIEPQRAQRMVEIDEPTHPATSEGSE